MTFALFDPTLRTYSLGPSGICATASRDSARPDKSRTHARMGRLPGAGADDAITPAEPGETAKRRR